jgi:hypothetical protein
VEQLGAGSGTEGVQTLPETAFELIGPHRSEPTPPRGRNRPHVLTGDRRHASTLNAAALGGETDRHIDRA